MDYEKVAAEFIERKMPRGHAHHPPLEKYQLFTKGERFALFYLIHTDGGVTPGDITRATHTSSARVAMVLKTLEAKGYISRSPDPQDRRKVLVSVTKAGRAIIAREQKELIKIIATIFERMGERDTTEFVRLFGTFFDYMSENCESCEGNA
ncbi:MAG: MarR family transcriptional regulator [Clostridiales Family XIII bacterium]|jgi:DNA-binding MarR family transcriptional regulator|nr:MarR family transcriptional regulator [Clostridiales Family XIII bacterium]